MENVNLSYFVNGKHKINLFITIQKKNCKNVLFDLIIIRFNTSITFYKLQNDKNVIINCAQKNQIMAKICMLSMAL